MPLTRSFSKKGDQVKPLLESDDESAATSDSDETAFGTRRSRLSPTFEDVLNRRVKQLVRSFRRFIRESPTSVLYRLVRDRRVALLRRRLAVCRKDSADSNCNQTRSNTKNTHDDCTSQSISTGRKVHADQLQSSTINAFEILQGWFDFDNSMTRCTKPYWESALPANLLQQIDDFIRLDRLRRVEVSEALDDASLLNNQLLNVECGVLLARVYDESILRLNSVFQTEFLASVHFLKYQLDLLTSGRLTVVDVVYYEPLTVHMIEFLERQGALDLLLALLAFDAFEADVLDRSTADRHGEVQRESSECVATQLQLDAKVLFDKYVDEQASHTLGFSEPIRSRCESHIQMIQLVSVSGTADGEESVASDVFRVAAGCFEPARRVLLHALKRAYLSRFVQSEAYYAFVTELVRKLQHSGLLQSSLATSVNPMKLDYNPVSHTHTHANATGEESDVDNESGDDGVSSSSDDSASHFGSVTPHTHVHMTPVVAGVRRPSTTCSSSSNNQDWSSPVTFGTPTSTITPTPARLLPHSHLSGTPLTLGTRKNSGLLGSLLKSKRDKQKEEEAAAAQIALMVIQDVQTITTLGASFPNTIDHLPI